MDRFEFYKSYYENVLKEKNEINTSISLPMTILTLMAAAISNYGLNFNYDTFNILTIIFILFLVADCILFFMTLFYIIRWYSGIPFKKLDYKYIPFPKDIEDYYNNLSESYKDAVEEQQGLAQHYLEESMMEYYIEAGSHNANLNNQKAYDMRFSKIFLILTLYLTLLTFIPYIINHYQFPKDSKQNIQIINQKN